MQSTDAIVTFFDSIYNQNSCEDMARECLFIQRSTSKLKGHEFIKVLTLPSKGVSEASLDDLCERMKKFNEEVDITASALTQRINTAAAVELMKMSFQKALLQARERLVKGLSNANGILTNFRNVYFQDSTVCELNEKLAKIFKGARGGGHKSQLKVDLIHNFTLGLICDAKLLSGNVPDQGLSGRILEFIGENDLIIRDLGYFVLDIFKQIADMNAYYLSRIPPHIKVYLHHDDTQPVDLAKYLDKHYRNHAVIDIEVFIGKERLQTRLVAYRMPEDVVKERLRKARKRAKDTKRVLSDAKRNLSRFSLFITNATKEKIPAEMVGTIYRLRWEIELIFKQWKGLLKIDVLRGISQNRIECLVWGRLCMVMIAGMMSEVFMNLARSLCNRELSPSKLITYLMGENGLSPAVKEHRVDKLLDEIAKIMQRRLLKTKRGPKTMRERVNLFEPYYECGACA